jgi:hypothetical protein
MHQSQDSSPGFEVTYLIKFSFPATMLDSVFLAFGLNMLALHESSIPLRIHARGTLTDGTDTCARPILPLDSSNLASLRGGILADACLSCM